MKPGTLVKRGAAVFTAILMALNAFFPSTAFAVTLLEGSNLQPTRYFSIDQLTQSTSPTPTATQPQTTSLAPGTGLTYYVSKTGANTSNGSQTNPFGTIAYAVSRLQAGDTLIIEEGTYNERVNLAASGTATNAITIQGHGNVVIDNAVGDYYDPAFDTAGYDYLRFVNLTVKNSRAGVKVSAGSSHIYIDGLKTDGSQFAVVMTDASDIEIRNSVAANSRNAFRGEGSTHDVLIENVEAYGSKDIYTGYDVNYLNGDGFIFEITTSNLTIRNAVSHDHWDAGYDIKASNALLENVVSYGNKNNFKTWGNNVRIVNALSFNAKIERQPNGGSNEGYGINVRQGSTTVVNSTFVNNENTDVKNGTSSANLTLVNSIVARNVQGGRLFEQYGTFTQSNVLWYGSGAPAGGLSGDPLFANWAGMDFRLLTGSAAKDKGAANSNLPGYDLEGKTRIVGTAVDLGAYEFQAPLPPVDPKTYLTGISDGATVSGNVIVQVPTALRPTVTGVTYKLNGQNSVGMTTSPFTWGDAGGYDTRNIANGSYTLDAAIQTTDRGLLNARWTFTVQNSVITPPPVDTSLAFNEAGGTVVMEGESFFGSTTVNGQSWTMANQTGTSNGKGLTAGPDLGRVLNFIAQSPRADFKIHINTPGTYYVWVRGFAKDGNSDSLHVGLDGSLITGGERVSNFVFDGTSASWTNRNMDQTRITFTVATAGDHVLNLWQREDGLVVDKIIVTRDAAFTPTGAGPAESARVTSTTPPTGPPAAPGRTTDGRFLGFTENTTVAGTVKIQLNTQVVSNATTVFYYLNGTQSTKVYSAPFTWGGTSGFDTRTLANGTYTLSGIIKLAGGSQLSFSYTFKVNNSLASGVVIDCTNPANASHIACL